MGFRLIIVFVLFAENIFFTLGIDSFIGLKYKIVVPRKVDVKLKHNTKILPFLKSVTNLGGAHGVCF